MKLSQTNDDENVNLFSVYTLRTKREEDIKQNLTLHHHFLEKDFRGYFLGNHFPVLFFLMPEKIPFLLSSFLEKMISLFERLLSLVESIWIPTSSRRMKKTLFPGVSMTISVYFWDISFSFSMKHMRPRRRMSDSGDLSIIVSIPDSYISTSYINQ